VEESVEVYRQFQRANADQLVTIFPDIEELLKVLKEQGYVLGIVTSRTRESALRYMDMFGITHYFSDMVTCEDTTIHKPNPEPLLLAMSKLGAAPEESIMIGDSPFDIKCANNAGVRSVLVDWRITCDASSMIEDAVEDFQIKKPMELVDLLKEL
jgi:pyrophosphatase PpaX